MVNLSQSIVTDLNLEFNNPTYGCNHPFKQSPLKRSL